MTVYTEKLLAYIFDGQLHPLLEPMTTWLESSRRFTTFVTAFQDKIRKKLRVTQDPESLLDLRLELETAYLLLQEKSLSVVYEPFKPREVRRPDFAVSFTTSLTFMLEVTRLRTDQKNSIISERLADTICSKLGQLLPQHSNVLLVGVETLQLTRDDLRAVMLQIQQRAEQNALTFSQRYRFRDPADFFRYYERLSELLVREAESTIAWVNPQAKHSLPSKVRTALYRSHNV